jgi:hypothetical protein
MADMKIKRAQVLESHLIDNETLETTFGNAGMRSTLLLPATAARPRLEYLKFHQANVFRG